MEVCPWGCLFLRERVDLDTSRDLSQTLVCSIQSMKYLLALMDTQESSRTQIPLAGLRFRVLIIGRANAGKTSILQRVCETTESPTIYREAAQEVATASNLEREEVRGPTFCLHVRSHCWPGYT